MLLPEGEVPEPVVVADDVPVAVLLEVPVDVALEDVEVDVALTTDIICAVCQSHKSSYRTAI